MATPSFYQGDEIHIDGITDKVITGALGIYWVMQLNDTVGLQKSLADDISAIDANTFRVVLAKADTLTMAHGVYDMQSLLVDSAGDEKVMAFDPPQIEIKRRLKFTLA